MGLKSVAILEFVCGGGVQGEPFDSLTSSLQREGRAMLEALAADWSEIPNRSVHVAWDRNLGEWRIPGVHVHECNKQIAVSDAWLRIGSQVDTILVIAPELNNDLLATTVGLRQKLPAFVRLLNADPIFCQAASDKWLTSQFFRAANVRHPETILWSSGSSTSDLPVSSNSTWVLKPRDGAGCESIFRFRSLQELTSMPRLFGDLITCPDKWIVQPWIEGEHGSLAVLCGDNARLVFPPMTQSISVSKAGMGHFLQYQGGNGPWWPVQPDMIDQFAKAVIDAIPGKPCGWIGVDFVVSKNHLGKRELIAIEINPRLTTSYLGVRAIVQENIPRLLEAVADGVPTKYSTRNSTVHFTTFGVSEGDELESR
jgi:tyramine---L-glutamate ligase